MRKAGSGLSPVNRRSKCGNENHWSVETFETFIYGVEIRTAVRELNVGEDEPRPLTLGELYSLLVRACGADHAMAEIARNELRQSRRRQPDLFEEPPNLPPILNEHRQAMRIPSPAAAWF